MSRAFAGSWDLRKRQDTPSIKITTYNPKGKRTAVTRLAAGSADDAARLAARALLGDGDPMDGLVPRRRPGSSGEPVD